MPLPKLRDLTDALWAIQDALSPNHPAARTGEGDRERIRLKRSNCPQLASGALRAQTLLYIAISLFCMLQLPYSDTMPFHHRGTENTENPARSFLRALCVSVVH